MTDNKKEEKKENFRPADEEDIDLHNRYTRGPYTEKLKTLEGDIKNLTKSVNSICGVRESETGIALPSNWNTDLDRKLISEDSLMVGRLTKIMEEKDPVKLKYVIHIR